MYDFLVYLDFVVDQPVVCCITLCYLTQVINDPGEFSLYIVQDTGVIQACKEEEHPLMTRLKLGPNEVRIILYCSA